MKRLIALHTLLVVFLSFAPTADQAMAEAMSITFATPALVFNNGAIYDADGAAGRTGSTGDATALECISFVANDEEVAYLDTDVFADMLIQGMPAIPTDGGTATSTGAVFVDLLDADGTLLGLPIDTMSAVYLSIAGREYISLSGTVAGPIVQSLPAELEIGPSDRVVFSWLGDISSKTLDGQQIVGFEASGTGVIDVTETPEPGTLALALSLACATIVVRVWHRR